MSDYSELVKSLRCCVSPGCQECAYKKHDNSKETCISVMVGDAADAIEALQAEKAAVQGELDAIRVFTDEAQRRIEELQAELQAAHWISVEDELPRHNAVVVVSDGKRSWDVGQYHFLLDADDRTRWWWKKHTTRKVLWWMYKENAIPDPPKGEQK